MRYDGFKFHEREPENIGGILVLMVIVIAVIAATVQELLKHVHS